MADVYEKIGMPFDKDSEAKALEQWQQLTDRERAQSLGNLLQAISPVLQKHPEETKVSLIRNPSYRQKYSSTDRSYGDNETREVAFEFFNSLLKQHGSINPDLANPVGMGPDTTHAQTLKPPMTDVSNN